MTCIYKLKYLHCTNACAIVLSNMEENGFQFTNLGHQYCATIAGVCVCVFPEISFRIFNQNCFTF